MDEEAGLGRLAEGVAAVSVRLEAEVAENMAVVFCDKQGIALWAMGGEPGLAVFDGYWLEVSG